MASLAEPLITPDEVQDILAETKETLNPIQWKHRPGTGETHWMEFASPCRIKGETRDDVIFRAAYRPASTLVPGQAAIMLPETFSASLFLGPHRVFGLDSGTGFHTSLAGAGRPQHRSVLTGQSHVHLWSEEGEGYAEPLDPTPRNIAALVEVFLAGANLTLNGGFAHPLKGRQIELML